MKTIKIVGQDPKLFTAGGEFLGYVGDGFVHGQPRKYESRKDDPTTRVLVVEEHGGFDDPPMKRHVFPVGTVVRIVKVGNEYEKSITKLEVPE